MDDINTWILITNFKNVESMIFSKWGGSVRNIEFATKIFRITGVLNNDIPSIPRFTISIESDFIFFKGGKRCSKKPDASNRHPSQPVHR